MKAVYTYEGSSSEPVESPSDRGGNTVTECKDPAISRTNKINCWRAASLKPGGDGLSMPRTAAKSHLINLKQRRILLKSNRMEHPALEGAVPGGACWRGPLGMAVREDGKLWIKETKKLSSPTRKKEQKNSGLKKQTGAKICLRNCF